jgi:hypothetical protein
MLYETEREYILAGPHEYVCDYCRLPTDPLEPDNYAHGRCFYCDRPGFHQVYRTGYTWLEVALQAVVVVAIVLAMSLFVWVTNHAP